GKMEKELITVNYYYKKKAEITITVKYIDKETKEEIQESITITDYEGEAYKTEQKEIDGYEFVEVEGETEGILTEDKEVIYYYSKIKEPEIPGEGGDDPVVDPPKEPDDTTIIETEIPKAGMMKQVIAVTTVSSMTLVTIVLLIVALKGIALDKKKRM
ncbi:MAG: MucBP domain-containing protein, partial [Clostridia bacterium]|nr:MucBP domain-containing protein [Clostridia bacterium]